MLPSSAPGGVCRGGACPSRAFPLTAPRRAGSRLALRGVAGNSFPVPPKKVAFGRPEANTHLAMHTPAREQRTVRRICRRKHAHAGTGYAIMHPLCHNADWTTGKTCYVNIFPVCNRWEKRDCGIGNNWKKQKKGLKNMDFSDVGNSVGNVDNCSERRLRSTVMSKHAAM